MRTKKDSRKGYTANGTLGGNTTIRGGSNDVMAISRNSLSASRLNSLPPQICGHLGWVSRAISVMRILGVSWGGERILETEGLTAHPCWKMLLDVLKKYLPSAKTQIK